jgi:alkylhydroperoxidase family enzyme
MPRLPQVSRAETDHPLVHAMYDLIFGAGVDPLADPDHPVVTSTGSDGSWWTVFALSPEILQHCVGGFTLYRSPDRELDPVLRELAQARVGWAKGSSFVYSQHCKSLRGYDVPDDKIAAIPGWAASPLFSDLERAVLAYTDALAYDGGRVDDAVFAVLRDHLSDVAVLELTYITALYEMHAIMSRALRTEFDDRPEPVVEVPAPEGFDSHEWTQLGATEAERAKRRGR